MRFMYRRAALVLVGVAMAISLTVGVAGASAKPATTAAQEKKQNHNITKALTGVATLATGLKATNGVATATKANVATLQGNVTTLQGSVTGLQSGLSGLQSTFSSAATTITGALTTLGNGLTSLKSALTNVLTNTEYGFIQLTAGGTPIPGCFFETPNLPANVNSADLSGSCLVAAPSGTLGANAGVRGVPDSANASTNGVAEAGISAVTVMSSNGTAITAAEVCANTAAPSGPFTGAAVIAIPTASPATGTGPDASFPFSQVPADNVVNLLGSQFGCATPTGATGTLPTLSALTIALEVSAHFNTANANGLNPSA